MAELGAIASVISIAGAGAKLSIACIEFASNIGSAGSEIVAVGTEISQFCVVLKQIEATLTKAKKTVRYSLTAILAIESITQQCGPIFQNIENILAGLKKDNKEPNFLSRLAWVLKRSKVQLLRKTLESSKLTLSCMLMTLLFAENIASRNASTVETRKEDDHQQAVTESLLLARECSVAELERLEEEDISTNEGVRKENSTSNHARSLSSDAVSSTRTQRRNNRRSAVMDGAFLPSVIDPENVAGKRNSLLLNSVLIDSASPISQQLANIAISQKRNSQPVELLKRWTNEGHRLSKLVESPEDERHIPAWEGPEALSIPGAREPSPGNKHSTTKTPSFRGGFELDVTPPSPPKGPAPELWTVREALHPPQYRPLIIQGGGEIESFRLTRNSTADGVLLGALERYHNPSEWSKYNLFVEYGIHHRQCRPLGPREYPLRVFDQLYQENKSPIFKLMEREHPAGHPIPTPDPKMALVQPAQVISKRANVSKPSALFEYSGPPLKRLFPVSVSIPRYYLEKQVDWYIISAMMEDGRNWELRRNYPNFYDLQISLLQRFPEEAGLTEKPRTLPWMPGPVTYVTDAISKARRGNLDHYFKKLLLMPTHISQSDLVCSMFVPQEGDSEVFLAISSDL